MGRAASEAQSCYHWHHRLQRRTRHRAADSHTGLQARLAAHRPTCKCRAGSRSSRPVRSYRDLNVLFMSLISESAFAWHCASWSSSVPRGGRRGRGGNGGNGASKTSRWLLLDGAVALMARS